MYGYYMSPRGWWRKSSEILGGDSIFGRWLACGILVAGGWHTETHDPHANHLRESSDGIFFRVYLRGSSTTRY